jgi:hypothetical protein
MSLPTSVHSLSKILAVSLLTASLATLGCGTQPRLYAVPEYLSFDTTFPNRVGTTFPHQQTAHVRFFGVAQGQSRVELTCKDGSNAEKTLLCNHFYDVLTGQPSHARLFSVEQGHHRVEVTCKHGSNAENERLCGDLYNTLLVTP